MSPRIQRIKIVSDLKDASSKADENVKNGSMMSKKIHQSSNGQAESKINASPILSSPDQKGIDLQ
jgi:hypothetical protein